MEIGIKKPLKTELNKIYKENKSKFLEKLEEVKKENPGAYEELEKKMSEQTLESMIIDILKNYVLSQKMNKIKEEKEQEAKLEITNFSKNI